MRRRLVFLVSLIVASGGCGRIGFDHVDPTGDAPRDSRDANLPVSCRQEEATCGLAANASCCTNTVVSGGTYDRSNDAMYPATIASLRLDVYEITVGRFRRFVQAGMGTGMAPPASGAGAHPSIAGSGWQEAWNTNLPATTAALSTALHCAAATETWTDSAGPNESKPINCITWYEAFAFCIWDGGRLATEAEWNYAAAGGDEQRVFPWSNPPGSMTVNATLAVYNTSGVANVGSKSLGGDGRWGQADLAGNVAEWSLDWYNTPYGLPCGDCASVTGNIDRTFRGGSFANAGPELVTSRRNFDLPTTRGDYLGSRCARSP